jgi:hypothetical protein
MSHVDQLDAKSLNTVQSNLKSSWLQLTMFCAELSVVLGIVRS